MHRHGVAVLGTGSYVPDQVLTNDDLARMVDTTDEWIRTRTGISERHVAPPEEPTSVMACRAGERALEAAGVDPREIDLIVVATLSPDRPFPNTACFVQSMLGASKAACFSLEAACSGFIYGLEVAANLVRGGNYRKALVIGAEKVTMYVDWEDRATCVLFGDGAGAIVLGQVEPERDCLLAASLGADGTYTDLLYVAAGGSRMPVTHEALDNKGTTIRMAGREVFKLAVNAMVGAGEGVLREAGVTIDQVRWLVPHQANQRIISAVGERLGIPAERVVVNLDRYGNTSAASIPIALDETVRAGKVDRGDLVLLVAFGGGLTWGAALLRW